MLSGLSKGYAFRLQEKQPEGISNLPAEQHFIAALLQACLFVTYRCNH
jgi:hypothetical protein